MGDEIHVDTDGLTSFADDLAFYATEVDPPDIDRSRQQFAGGVTFGVNNASGPVFVAKTNYTEALKQSLANLSEYVRAAEILADAAEQTARDFQAADARSADAVDTVNRTLYAATERADIAAHMFGPPMPRRDL